MSEQPNSIRLYMLTASELMSQKRLDEAADVAKRGRELMPDYHEIWIQSGVIALEAGKLDDADMFLDRALNLKPGFKAGAWKDKVAQRRRELPTPK
jgi:predicted Zn-dependent protease